MPMTQSDLQPHTDSRRPRFLREAGLVFLLATLLGGFWQANPGLVESEDGPQFVTQRTLGLMPGDSAYHIRMAWLYRTGELQAAGADFHWTRLSVWNGHFADKDFLFHIYLVPFTSWADDASDHAGLAQGAKLGAAVGWGLLALALVYALRLLGVRPAWPWLLLIPCLSWLFLLRAMELRSWLFSASLVALGWASLVQRRHAAVFCVGVVYALSYTAAHLLLVLAAYHWLARLALGPEPGGTRLADARSGLKLTAMAALGLFAGWLLHPQAMQLPGLWWVQNFLVVYLQNGGTLDGMVASITSLLLGSQTLPPDLGLQAGHFGNELKPTDAQGLWLGFGAAFLFAALATLAGLLLRVRLTRAEQLTFGLALPLLVLIARSVRVSEYAMPMLVLGCGMYLPRILAQTREKLGRRGPLLTPCLRSAAAIAFFAQAAWLHRIVPHMPPSPYPAMSHWLQTSSEARGRMVYNVSWDSFPELFLSSAASNYAAGLDPAFTALHGSRASRAYLLLQSGRADLVANDGPGLVRFLREEAGADFVFVDGRNNPVMRHGLREMSRFGLLETVLEDDQRNYALYRLKPEAGRLQP